MGLRVYRTWGKKKTGNRKKKKKGNDIMKKESEKDDGMKICPQDIRLVLP